MSLLLTDIKLLFDVARTIQAASFTMPTKAAARAFAKSITGPAIGGFTKPVRRLTNALLGEAKSKVGSGLLNIVNDLTDTMTADQINLLAQLIENRVDEAVLQGMSYVTGVMSIDNELFMRATDFARQMEESEEVMLENGVITMQEAHTEDELFQRAMMIILSNEQRAGMIAGRPVSRR